VIFGRLAEYAATLTKGAHVQVEGDLRHREYTPQPKNGSDNGVTLRTVAEIRVTSITKLDRPATTAGSPSPASSAANPNPDPAIAAAATAEEVPF
jgi:single-strand DNA-binding protein